MPDGSLVTGHVAQPAVDEQPAGDGDSVATARETAKGAVSREPAGVAPKPAYAKPAVRKPAVRKPALPKLLPAEPVPTAPLFVEVTVPAGTMLSLLLESGLASDVSQVEDPVRARIDRPVTIDGRRVIPQGGLAYGTVTMVEASGKVKGRGRLAFRFDQIDLDGDRYEIRTESLWYEAESTKAEDAKKIGISAGAGALIGGLLGGRRGAGAGAVIGGGAGTAVALTTAGEEVRLRSGTPVEVSLTQPLVLLISEG